VTRLSLITAVWIAVAIPLSAQTTEEPVGDHSNMDMADPVAGDLPASTQAFIAATTTMHSDMTIEYTGNADIDFIRGMIPHHQGAVDAARIVLEHGSDPEVRKFAEQVIAAQEAEIAWMADWLAKAEQ
jgi:uncharacterized protein (DUF305 family)